MTSAVESTIQPILRHPARAGSDDSPRSSTNLSFRGSKDTSGAVEVTEAERLARAEHLVADFHASVSLLVSLGR